MRSCLIFVLVVAGTLFRAGAQDVESVHYPASSQVGAFPFESSFHVWISPETKLVRAVIVHQHGCGDGAENSGETAALDLHWRALAKKHDAALVSPHYSAQDAECRLWCDPRNGSGEVFLQAIHDLALITKHPEMENAPWCLWGHSGGGFWASLMLEKYSNRILGIFCRSGTAASAWMSGEVKAPVYPPAAYQVPMVINPGLQERDDVRFKGAWTTSTQFFNFFRSRGAPVAFAPDPFSGHDCRNSRLMAIPFFDACLGQRLPMRDGQPLSIGAGKGWLGEWTTGAIKPPGAMSETDARTLSWLPDAASARAFSEYVRFGITTDATAPLVAPKIVSVKPGPARGEFTIQWTAEADFESGIRQFAIYRDGVRIAVYPSPNVDLKQGFPQFQGISYHDTPLANSPKMVYTDTPPEGSVPPAYAVMTINTPGLESPLSKAVRPLP